MPDEIYNIFIEIVKINNFVEFKKECYKSIKSSVLLLGQPDSNKDWQEMIDEYMKKIYPTLPTIRSALNIGLNIGKLD